MECKKFMLNKAEYIIRVEDEISLIEEVILSLRIPLTEGVARKGKFVNQKILNAMFRHKLAPIGWGLEPQVDPKGPLQERGDFGKTLKSGLRVFVEVEFGYVASVYRNLFKFNQTLSLDSYDLCIMVLPSDKFSTKIDTAMSFEKLVKVIESAKNAVSPPLLLMGIDPLNKLSTPEKAKGDHDYIDCLPLEPKWPVKIKDQGGKKVTNPKWKMTDEDADNFVERHADKLFRSF